MRRRAAALILLGAAAAAPPPLPAGRRPTEADPAPAAFRVAGRRLAAWAAAVRRGADPAGPREVRRAAADALERSAVLCRRAAAAPAATTIATAAATTTIGKACASG
jgi:hypothetical protein